jgi:hypothetical protein
VKQYAFSAALAVIGMCHPGAVVAQSRSSAPEKFWTCTQRAGYEGIIVVGPFIASLSNEDQAKMILEVRQLVSETFHHGSDTATCGAYSSMEEAYQNNESLRRKSFFSAPPYNWRYFPDWVPSFIKPVPPQSNIKSMSLDFEPGDGSSFLHARRGYRRASIKLNYRFLLCANEIQMAYGLNRKSLEHSTEYVDKFNGINPNMIVPGSEPPVPMTIPITLKIIRKVPGTPLVTTVRDGTAGESLGMGCFTGQTATIGLVAKLIGPQATRPMIKVYLDTLDATELSTGASLGYALLNPDVPTPPSPAPRPRTPIKRKAN